MEYKQAAKILIELQKKQSLAAEEKTALDAAIGLLVWADLSKSRIKNIKAKRDKSLD